MSIQVRDLFDDPVRYLETLLWIRDKQERVIPFTLNAIQRVILRKKAEALARGRKPRFIYLKYRRGGVTTLEQGLTFARCASRRNVQAILLAHDHESTELLFRAANLFYERLEPAFRPRRLTQHNKRNLDFIGIQSLYTVGTAGKFSVGRGATFNKVHWSEVAFSPGDVDDQQNLLASIDEAASHGEVVLESTPNGVGNLFHQLCSESLDGKGPWNLIFLPWFEDPDNRLPLTEDQALAIQASLSAEEEDLVHRHKLDAGQIAWRRERKEARGVLFAQEFPEDPMTCFLVSGVNFFDTTLIQGLIREGTLEPIEVRSVRGSRPGTGGQILIWAKPREWGRYGAACDVAGGGAMGNQSICAVGDLETCEQVAVLRGRWEPEDFAMLAGSLAGEYNQALLGVEKQNHGHSTLNTLVNTVRYDNLYHHLNYAGTAKPEREPGWSTDPKTRPVMLGELRDAIEKRWMPVRDRVLLEQCLTFKLDKDEAKYKAAPGCLDDTVIAWSIFLQLRKDLNAATVNVSSASPVIVRGRIYGMDGR